MSMRRFIRKHRAMIDEAIRRAWPNAGRLNDDDRAEWIHNDESLYNWARSEGVKI